MTPELLAMITDVPAATDERLETVARDLRHHTDTHVRMEKGRFLSLIARIVAERKVASDREALLDTANALVTCCCGNPVGTHGMGDGHSPVDMYHHHMRYVEQERDTALLRAETFERQYRQVSQDHAEMRHQRDAALSALEERGS